MTKKNSTQIDDNGNQEPVFPLKIQTIFTYGAICVALGGVIFAVQIELPHIQALENKVESIDTKINSLETKIDTIKMGHEFRLKNLEGRMKNLEDRQSEK